jgi:hypothetical protein
LGYIDRPCLKTHKKIRCIIAVVVHTEISGAAKEGNDQFLGQQEIGKR